MKRPFIKSTLTLYERQQWVIILATHYLLKVVLCQLIDHFEYTKKQRNHDFCCIPRQQVVYSVYPSILVVVVDRLSRMI